MLAERGEDAGRTADRLLDVDESAQAEGTIARRLIGLIRRLPMVLQGYVFWAIESFATFIVLILVIPVLAITLIVSTVLFGGLSWLLGWPTGPIGTILAFGWVGGWVVASVVITVRMWRSIPVLKALVAVAAGSLGAASEPAVIVPDPTAPTFQERIALADASLTPKPASAPAGDAPPAAGGSTV